MWLRLVIASILYSPYLLSSAFAGDDSPPLTPRSAQQPVRNAQGGPQQGTNVSEEQPRYLCAVLIPEGVGGGGANSLQALLRHLGGAGARQTPESKSASRKRRSPEENQSSSSAGARTDISALWPEAFLGCLSEVADGSKLYKRCFEHAEKILSPQDLDKLLNHWGVGKMLAYTTFSNGASTKRRSKTSKAVSQEACRKAMKFREDYLSSLLAPYRTLRSKLAKPDISYQNAESQITDFFRELDTNIQTYVNDIKL